MSTKTISNRAVGIHALRTALPRPFVTYLRGAATMTLLGLALVCGGTRAARAQFFLTLPANPMVLDATHGGTATFRATLTNNNPFALYLNSDTFVLQSPGSLDDTLFQNYFVTPPNDGAQPTLAANGGTITLSLFTVSLPANTPLGIYSGTITLQGGADQLAAADLDTEQFAVQAVTPAAPPPPAVPESGSATTLAALLCGIGMTARRGLYRRIRTHIPA